MLILGPTLFLFDSLGQNIGSYLSNIIPLSTWTESYGPVEAGWQHSYTVFYWAWWIAWSPFVGMFIARISKGRTIRQFVGGVLFVPTLVSSIWLTVFGGTALHRELYSGGGIVDAVKDNVATAMFELLATLPLAGNYFLSYGYCDYYFLCDFFRLGFFGWLTPLHLRNVQIFYV